MRSDIAKWFSIAGLAALLLIGCSPAPAPGPAAPTAGATDGHVSEADIVPATPMSIEASDLVISLSDFESDPNFSAFEWVAESETLRVWWFGTPPPTLLALLNASPVATEISAAVSTPGVLREIAIRLITEGAPGVRVTGAGVAADAGSLTVTAEAEDPTWTFDATRDALEAHTGVTVTLTLGQVVPI